MLGAFATAPAYSQRMRLLTKHIEHSDQWLDICNFILQHMLDTSAEAFDSYCCNTVFVSFLQLQGSSDHNPFLNPVVYSLSELE